jgi:thiol-disulfide isomerase/thioredoxin
MMKFFTLLVFTILFYGCKETKKKPLNNEEKITIIFGKRTFETDTLRFDSGVYTFDDDGIYYITTESLVKNQINKNNFNRNDTLVINTSEDIILHHGYNVNQYSLFRFEPGDSIFFIYENDLPVCKVFNKKTKNGVNFLTSYNVKFNKQQKTDDIDFFLKFNRFKNSNEIEEDTKNYKNKIKLFEKYLDSLNFEKKIDKKNYETYKKEFSYVLNEKQLTYQSKVDLSIPEARNIVYNSFNELYRPKLIKSNTTSLIDSRIQFELVLNDKTCPEENKEFLLYTFLNEIIDNFSNEYAKKYTDVFVKNIKNKDLIEKINKRTIGFKNLNSDDVFLVNNNKEQFSLNEFITTKFKNKIVYVDFWASWCAPCRATMPASKKLHEKYKNKDIEFIYISIDKNFEAWHKANLKEVLGDNNSFLAANYPEANFYKEHQLKTIPRYMIFYKGKLVDNNATAPDSPEIIKELNKYLDEE